MRLLFLLWANLPQDVTSQQLDFAVQGRDLRRHGGRIPPPAPPGADGLRADPGPAARVKASGVLRHMPKFSAPGATEGARDFSGAWVPGAQQLGASRLPPSPRASRATLWLS